MNDWGDDDVDELSRGSRTSSELLDLVRAAEEEARIATRQAPPSSAAQVVEADELLPDEVDEALTPAAADEFVDVGEDAVDAPASHPTPSAELTPLGRAALLPPLAPAPSARGGMHPLVAITLVFVLAGAALALLAR